MTLYAQYSGDAVDGDATVFEETEELKAGETYLLVWNSELYDNTGARNALTDAASNVTTMNTSCISDDGATISVPSNVNSSAYQWVCAASGNQFTFKNVSTNKYLAYANSALTTVAGQADTCLWNIVQNANSTDSRAPATKHCRAAL